jgi:hypothetical protein
MSGHTHRSWKGIMNESHARLTGQHTRCAWRNSKQPSQFSCTIHSRDRDQKPMREGLVLSGAQTRTARLCLAFDWTHHP